MNNVHICPKKDSCTRQRQNKNNILAVENNLRLKHHKQIAFNLDIELKER